MTTAPDAPPEQERRADEPVAVAATRQPRRRRGPVLAVVVVVVLSGAAAAVVVLRNRAADPVASSQPALNTAPITRGDVVNTESLDGTLTYAGERTVSASAAGVVTWVPRDGDTVTRGHPLYRVGNRPIVLMYGKLPVYRNMYPGVKGPDVRQLEANLKTAGFGDGITVDDEYTWRTADAVKDWQDANGLEKTGEVDDSQVVFEPGPVRVSDVKVAVGDHVGGVTGAMTVTDTRAVVHVDLAASKQSEVSAKEKVQVTMPDGKDVTGTVTAVGTVAKTDKDGNSTIGIDIAVGATKRGSIDQAPVTVAMADQRVHNVLSVPVEALLGLREGGFGVEVVENGASRIVRVTTGAYGGGRVQISGAGLREGMEVGVSAS